MHRRAAIRVAPARPVENALATLALRPIGATGPVPIRGYSLDDLIRHGDNLAVSRMTGGQAWTNEWPGKALNRVDTSSRCYDQRAYSPSSSVLDGRCRAITVKVSRPGVTVLVRGGYFAREAPPAPGRRTYLTENRIAAAGWLTDNLNDIRVQLQASIAPAVPPETVAVVVDLTIDASHRSLELLNGRHVGHLNVAVYCADKREALVGQVRQTLDLALGEDACQLTLGEGVRHGVRVPVRRPVRYVKAVVYDYGADVLGGAVVKLPDPRKWHEPGETATGATGC